MKVQCAICYGQIPTIGADGEYHPEALAIHLDKTFLRLLTIITV